MRTNSLVVADTSIWIDFFRFGKSVSAHKLTEVLEQDRVCLVPVIQAEILSGAKTEAEYEKLKKGLSALPTLEDFPGFWDTIARSRFRLARKGIQTSITDLMIAVTASHYGCKLLTLDKEFHKIGSVIPIQLEQ